MDLSIGKYMKVFDTDKMDIGRRIEIENPDGSTGETLPEEPIYIDVPCNISFKEIDNPDTETFKTKPIIMALQINCDLNVDLLNNDYIVAKKCDYKGEVLQTYKGNIGHPATDQNRTWAIMDIRDSI
ncbi:MAG: hypothetical protein RR420_05580 [Anaerovoracaceae bacterium]